MYCKKYLSFEYILLLQEKKRVQCVMKGKQLLLPYHVSTGSPPNCYKAAGVSGYEQLAHAVKCRNVFSPNLPF